MASINTSKGQLLTEADILKAVVRKRNFQQTFDFLSTNKSLKMNRGVSTKKWQDERVNQQKIA
jgi:hypothetical protein